MNLRGRAINTPTYTHTHKPPSQCSINLETEAWFICSQIKATEVERVEKIIPGKKKKNLKVSINNNGESVVYESCLEAGRRTEV